MLAHNVQIVAKRDTLYNIYAPLPPGQPIQFTLAANPYRAALIDYARHRGTLSLVPVSVAEKKSLDARRELVQRSPDQVVALSFVPGSAEYEEEERLLNTYTRGESTIGDDDLLRVFGLKPLAAATGPLTVEYYSGVSRSGSITFLNATRGGTFTASPDAPKAPTYLFEPPKK
jgi:hypothetical protein